MFKKITQIFWVSIIIFLFSYSFLWLFFHELNSNFVYYIKDHNKDVINKNLVVVEIDDVSYSQLGFPIDREDYIPFLRNLQMAKPAVVAFDILFLDQGKDSEKDTILAQAFQEIWNVILGFDIRDDNFAVLPFDIFYNAAMGVGYVQPFVNPYTQKVASIEPFRSLLSEGKNIVFESFSFKILREYFNYIYTIHSDENDIILSGNHYTSFGKKVPLVFSHILGQREVSEFYINYIEAEFFQRESFYNIYTGNFDREKLADKIVLIWYTAEGVKDDFFVPNYGIIKGVYVHANAINTILNENFIVYFDRKIELLISFLFIFFVVYINIFYLKNRNLKWIIFWSWLVFLCILLGYFLLFLGSYYKSWILLIPNYPFEFGSVLFLSFFSSAILKYVNEDKNKRLLSKALSEYVSSDITQEILHSTGQVNLSGENKQITTFFSDIAGFTTLSEKLSPEELVKFLRLYLSEMSNIIIDYKWFINKYEWDAIMALWWVFGKVEKFWVLHACEAALLQQKRLSELNDMWKSQWHDTFEVRMWIHTWNAIIGNIGAEGRKMEFTALGDTVNLWSRLEWVNKYYGTYICISEQVYEEVHEYFECRFLDKIRVKWKNNALKIYELVWYKNMVWDFKKQLIVEFEQALESYFARDFLSAQKLFQKLSQLGDAPSKIYMDRCEMFLKAPPENTWNGVWTMTDK